MGRWNEIDPFWLSPEEEAAMEQDADQERELTAEEDAAIERSWQELKIMLESHPKGLSALEIIRDAASTTAKAHRDEGRTVLADQIDAAIDPSYQGDEGDDPDKDGRDLALRGIIGVMRSALELISDIAEQGESDRSFRYISSEAYRALSMLRDWRASRAAPSADKLDDPDETYELGKRDGYEEAIQDLDLATGGDGEFKWSSFPDETVDVPVMKQRIIERLATVAAGEDRVVWLIERKGFAGDPRPHWYWEDALGHHAWTPEANAALPFKTKAEAETFPAYRMISRDPEISLTEHMFMAPASPSKRVERLETALRSFVNVKDQYPESVTLIRRDLDDLTPITVTVTKGQFLAAIQALQGGRS